MKTFEIKEFKNHYKASNGKTLKKVMWGIEIEKPESLIFENGRFYWVINGKKSLFLNKSQAEKFRKLI